MATATKSQSKTATKTTVADVPAVLPQPFLRPGAPDKVAIGARRFYERVVALGLPVPADVADAARALAHAAAWVSQPRADLPAAKAAWIAALITAAQSGDPQPPSDGLADAALREGALKIIGQSMEQATTELDSQVIVAIRRSFDQMLATLTDEHDRLTDRIRQLGAGIPATVVDGDTALRAGVGPAYMELTTVAERWFAVRDTRARAARFDHVRDAETYATWRCPDLIPATVKWPESPAVRAIAMVVAHADAEPWCPSRRQIEDRIRDADSEKHATRSRPRGRVDLGVPRGW